MLGGLFVTVANLDQHFAGWIVCQLAPGQDCLWYRVAPNRRREAKWHQLHRQRTQPTQRPTFAATAERYFQEHARLSKSSRAVDWATSSPNSAS